MMNENLPSPHHLQARFLSTIVPKSRAFIQLRSLTFRKYGQICHVEARFYRKIGKRLRTLIYFGEASMGEELGS